MTSLFARNERLLWRTRFSTTEMPSQFLTQYNTIKSWPFSLFSLKLSLQSTHVHVVHWNGGRAVCRLHRAVCILREVSRLHGTDTRSWRSACSALPVRVQVYFAIVCHLVGMRAIIQALLMLIIQSVLMRVLQRRHPVFSLAMMAHTLSQAAISPTLWPMLCWSVEREFTTGLSWCMCLCYYYIGGGDIKKELTVDVCCSFEVTLCCSPVAYFGIKLVHSLHWVLPQSLSKNFCSCNWLSDWHESQYAHLTGPRKWTTPG